MSTNETRIETANELLKKIADAQKQLLEIVVETARENDKTRPAETFVETLAANVDNDRLTDADFRDFVRNSLPAVLPGSRKTRRQKP